MNNIQTTDRYTLKVEKRLGDRVMDWSIFDSEALSAAGVTVAQGFALGYESAQELVSLANAGWRNFVVEVSK